MKVYIAGIDFGPYDGGVQIKGVFSTMEKAIAAFSGKHLSYADYVVAEIEVDDEREINGDDYQVLEQRNVILPPKTSAT